MQTVDDIKPCYPLFREEDYKVSLKNKQDLFEERHSPEKVQEVFLWTTTQEYQDLNFKREALTVDPAKACQPLGAVLCALGFEKTLPYVHGSQGCVSYFRTYFNRHFKEPICCVSDSMTEDAAVFGLNAVSDGRHVVAAAQATGFIAQLRAAGYVPVPVDLSELLKGGGGIKCCTLELRPAAPAA